MDAAGLQKLFEPFATVAVKGMFGGRGVYAEGLMFALQASEDIYLKTDAVSAPRFQEAGSRPFVYRSPMGPKATSYWLMPPAAATDEKALKAWRRLALEAARRVASAKLEKGARRGKTGAARSLARRSVKRPSHAGAGRGK